MRVHPLLRFLQKQPGAAPERILFGTGGDAYGDSVATLVDDKGSIVAGACVISSLAGIPVCLRRTIAPGEQQNWGGPATRAPNPCGQPAALTAAPGNGAESWFGWLMRSLRRLWNMV
jgi:hypothetical protein